MHISTNVHMTGVVNASMTVVMDFSNNSLWLAFGWSKCRWQIKLKLTQTSLQHVISVFDLGVPLQPVDLPRYILQYSVFRIPYSVFCIPYSVFRILLDSMAKPFEAQFLLDSDGQIGSKVRNHKSCYQNRSVIKFDKILIKCLIKLLMQLLINLWLTSESLSTKTHLLLPRVDEILIKLW